MSIAVAPSIKPGVFFAPSGRHGVVMDLAANRYLAISAESRAIWTALAQHTPVPAIIESYSADHHIPLHQAQTVVGAQFHAWREAGLLTETMEAEAPERSALPEVKVAGAPAAAAFDRDDIAQERLSPIALVRVNLARRSWERHLFDHGLAATLIRLQQSQSPASALETARAERLIRRALRAYYAARLPFRQGSNDCLARSIALASLLRACGREIDLCIGIRPLPFSAHCWLEWRGRLINEIVPALADYVVIARF
jgi:hypothetical protein